MRVLVTVVVAALLAVQAAGGQTPETGPQRGGGAGQQFDPRTVLAGELLIEPPTLINLGFEGFVDGDDNRNAAVTVSYRRAGETSWNESLPLLRLKGERVYSEYRIDV